MVTYRMLLIVVQYWLPLETELQGSWISRGFQAIWISRGFQAMISRLFLTFP